MTNQSLKLRNARIKLQQRHSLEWSSLLTTQQTVWRLVDEETTQKLFECQDDQVACFQVKMKKALQLTKIIVIQREEREQLKTRQQLDFFLLEQGVETTRKPP